MKIYKTSKKPLIIIYALLAGLFTLVRLFTSLIKSLIDRYLPYSIFTEKYVLIPVGVAVGLLAAVVLPFYFYKARFIISSGEISAVGGLMFTSRQFMRMEAVKSVTSLMLPLGKFTGFNFIILNTLGARVILPFLSRKDAQEIFSFVNSSIRGRGEQV